jgi:hypothetical protein
MGSSRAPKQMLSTKEIFKITLGIMNLSFMKSLEMSHYFLGMGKGRLFILVVSFISFAKKDVN